MKKIKIYNRNVGEGESCFIIAEAGINHNGDINLAKKLVNAAKKCGADAIKFQTFKAEDVTVLSSPLADYQKKKAGTATSQFELIKKYEISQRDFIALKKYCDKNKILFLSTPHTFEAIDFLDNLVPAFKIGSGDITNLPFLKKIAKKRKPVILSTGMSNIYEIEDAIKSLTQHKCKKIILLQCTTSYPAPIDSVNLNAIKTLKDHFKFPVGLSDHTLSVTIPAASVALGTCVIEKHITLNKSFSGPDHSASLDPQEFKNMVQAIREVEKALGNGVKKPTKDEEKIKKIVRKSIVTKANIPRGSIINKNMIEIKRPGTGIPPKYFDKIIGSKTKVKLKKDEIIKWHQIE